MDDIILERSAPAVTVMKLNDSEQAMLDEIEIKPVAARKRPLSRPSAPAPGAVPGGRFENMDAFTNPVKRARREPRFQQREEYVEEEEEDDGMEEGEEDGAEGGQGYPGGGPGGGGGGGTGVEETPSPGYSSIDDEKADLLNKLARLEKKGLNVNKRLNAYSDISEIRTEYKRLLYGIEAEQSIKFSRRMLIACVTGIEFLNKRYNPFDIMLEGWSESVMENVDDYDGVFEELYTKYRTKMHVAPEVKLIMMLGGSGMMFHLTNSMFKAAVPNMNDVLKQNPELVQNMMNAVKNTQAQQGAREDASARPVQRTGGDTPGTSARREMQGPGLDISSLMGGIMMPPMPINTSTREVNREPVIELTEDENMSDIVSVSGGDDLKEVRVKAARGGGGKKKKVEVSL
jgi:hypothetical protein